MSPRRATVPARGRGARDRAGLAPVGLMRAGLVRRLLTLLDGHHGLSPAALLDETGLGRGELDRGDTLVSIQRAVALLDSAARATGDATLGLRLATAMQWNDFGVLGYVLVHSPTLGAAFGNLRRYIAIHQTRGGIDLEVGPRVARVLRPTDAILGQSDQVVDLSLAMYTRLARDGLGEPRWTPRAVCFRRRRPRSTAVHTRWFGAPLSFGQPRDALVLDSAELRRPFRAADPGLYPILLAQADTTLAGSPGRGEVGGDVRQLVVGALGAGDVTIEAVAGRLGVAPRSLQRRLRDVGLSFQMLLAEARLDLARRHLADPSLTLTETAFLLGYADLSAFSRAFRRWTGKSPQAFRRAARPTDRPDAPEAER